MTLCYFCDIMIVAPLGATLNFYLKGKFFMKTRYRSVPLGYGHVTASFFIEKFFYYCSEARSEYDFSHSVSCRFFLNELDKFFYPFLALKEVGAISDNLFCWLGRYKDKTYHYCGL